MSAASACRLGVRAIAAALGLVALDAAAGERIVLNLNPDWKFVKADPPGAEATGFDDRAWQPVSLPHTYNDVDTFDDWSTPGHRGEQNQWSGRTWYRKAFTLPGSMRGQKVFVEFEAARQVAEVYLNGRRLGVHKTGFTPFGFDLTPHVRFGGRNVLAVMCDNRFMKDPLEGGRNLAQTQAIFNEAMPERLEDLAGDRIPWNNPHWHPAHGGLYRNARLYVTDPLHVSLPLMSFLETVGPYAYAGEISARAARVHVEVPIENGRGTAESVELRVELFDAEGRPVLALGETRAVAAGARAELRVSGMLAAPRLWEPAYPHVYRVAISLRAGGQVVDTTEVPLGVRSVRWDAAEGFFINGRRLKLAGWGQKPTNEWPGLGAALPDWLHFLTLRLMKDAGGNLVRWGHTAAGPSLISAGDGLGLVTIQPGVDGEHDTIGAAWALRSSAFRDVIVYFRNHPSILVWEGGNQKVSREHASELRAHMDRYDPHGGRAYAHRRADAVTAEFMDVGIGTEGGREIASLPVVEGEYDREESPRRVWDDASPPGFGYPEAKGQTYQLTSEQFAVNQVAQFVKKLGAPEHSGGANWIFSDSTSGGRVSVEVARASGEVDGVRLPKEAYHACAAMFRSDPQVHIVGHWTYPPGTKKAVHVVSNADEVELRVNGRSLGRGRRSDRHLFTFDDVAWEAGEITAVAMTAGQAVATQSKQTAGPPAALRLSPITGPEGLRADGSDVALFDVEAVDAEGRRCPTVQQRVDFELDGPGIWRGGYNSGKIASVNNAFLDLEAGINRVAVRATRSPGRITLRARSDGLKAAVATVESLPLPAEGGVATRLPARTPVSLPAEAPAWAFAAADGRAARPGEGAPAMVGRFVRAFSYSGPSGYIVHVESQARDGKNAYVDADSPFAGLPAELVGADWVQAANRESLYGAVDLMELAVRAGSVVRIAHDDRLPRPAWLRRQFQPSASAIVVLGQRMTLFERRVASDESLTLGANTEDPRVQAAGMYVVFVSASVDR